MVRQTLLLSIGLIISLVSFGQPPCSDYVTWTSGDWIGPSGSNCTGVTGAHEQFYTDGAKIYTHRGWCANTGPGEYDFLEVGSCSAVLPVELIDFNFKSSKSQVALHWQTATETNNAGFEIQRSTDGKNFQNLSFIEGKGTTHEQQDYVYEDKDLRSGQLYYYRLKQIDFDGQFEYSEIITARTAGKEIIGTFAPNPAVAGQTTLAYTTAEAGELLLSIFNIAGKEVLRQTPSVVSGTNSFDLDLSGLDAGMLFVKMQQGQQMVYEKIVIE